MGNYSPGQLTQSIVTFYDANIVAGNMPDIGIDPALLKYSGLDSTALVQEYSSAIKEHFKENAGQYSKNLIKALGGFTSVPNAVDLGALVISMIIEIVARASNVPTESHANMLRRVFAEQKRIELRDLVDECLKRYRLYLTDNSKLLEKTEDLEQKISAQLTRVRNAMLKDGQMDSPMFKEWVNGAAFHVQMLIQLSRLDNRGTASAKNAIDIYEQDLKKLLEVYATYKMSTIEFTHIIGSPYSLCSKYKSKKKRFAVSPWGQPSCYFCDHESGKYYNTEWLKLNPSLCFGGHNWRKGYVDYVGSHYQQIIDINKYFSDTRNNLHTLVAQRHNIFTV